MQKDFLFIRVEIFVYHLSPFNRGDFIINIASDFHIFAGHGNKADIAAIHIIKNMGKTLQRLFVYVAFGIFGKNFNNLAKFRAFTSGYVHGKELQKEVMNSFKSSNISGGITACEF